MGNRILLAPVLFLLGLLVFSTALGQSLETAHEMNEGRASIDPCKDFWAYACGILKDKKATREEEKTKAVKRFRAALRDEGKRLGVLGPREKEILTPLGLSFSDETNREKIAELAKDPNKLLEWMKAHVSQGELLGGIPPEWDVHYSKAISKDYPDVRKAPWNTLPNGEQRVRAFYNYIFAKADPEAGRDLAQRATDRFMNGVYIGLLQQILKKEPKFNKTLVDRLLPDDQFKILESDFAELKGQLPNISPLHAKMDASRLGEISLVKRAFADEDNDPWHMSDWADGGGGYGRGEIEAGGIFGEIVPGRRMFVLAHELGHAASDINRFDDKLRVNDERIAQKLMENLGFKKNGNEAEELLGDWYASQIFSHYLEHRKPSLSNDEQKNYLVESVVSCESDEISAARENHPASVGLTKHPSPRIRTNDVVMAHPYFRRLFQCPSEGAPLYVPPTLAYAPKTKSPKLSRVRIPSFGVDSTQKGILTEQARISGFDLEFLD